jgi:hypothetical protein
MQDGASHDRAHFLVENGRGTGSLINTSVRRLCQAERNWRREGRLDEPTAASSKGAICSEVSPVIGTGGHGHRVGLRFAALIGPYCPVEFLLLVLSDVLKTFAGG